MARIDIQKRAELIARQSAKITAIRDDLEQSPITLTGGVTMDANRISTDRMDSVLDNWTAVTFMRDEDGKQLWKAANNSIVAYTEAEFIAMVAELKERRTARSDRLFAYSETQRATLPLPDNDAVFDPSSWPVEEPE
jgi:hypothetical protein